MKILTVCILFVLLESSGIKAQVVIGGLAPDSSAMLDIQSDGRGFLLPRLSLAQRDSIEKPAEGLQIYNLTTRCLELNLGSPTQPLWAELKCLGVISTLDCANFSISDSLIFDQSSSGITVELPYTGGNGEIYAGQSFNSAGVPGLTATLSQGSFEDGNGSLVLSLNGTATQSGTATFALTIGGQSCVLEAMVRVVYRAGYVSCDSTHSAVVQDVTNPTTGKTWMDRNLGAKRVATADDDAEAYGDMFQWGRFADGHQCRNSPVTSTIANTAVPNAGNSWDGNFIIEESENFYWLVPQNDNLWQGVNGVNNPCPIGYRLPTETELENERQGWSQNNGAGAFASTLRFPSGGSRDGYDGSLFNVGNIGLYLSSSVSSFEVRTLGFNSSQASFSGYHRALGGSVRCLKD